MMFIKNQPSKIIFVLCFLLAIFGLWMTASHAEIVSVEDLIRYPSLYNREKVEIQGEVVGDIMRRGEYSWINIQDGEYAIGVWVLASLTKDIKFSGSYSAKGAIVSIVGTFNRNCPIHGSDFDIHAESLVIKSNGKFLDRPISDKKIQLILYLGALALCLSLLSALRKKRKA